MRQCDKETIIKAVAKRRNIENNSGKEVRLR